METTRRPRLMLRWVPVTDARGRTHMEGVWVAIDPAVAKQPVASRHAA